MDIQEQVIALVHGDIEKNSHAADILRTIVASPENVDVLLHHITLSRSMSSLRHSIVSPTTETRTLLHQQINQFEQKRSLSTTIGFKQLLSSRKSMFFYFTLALFSFGAGMLFQERKGEIPHSSETPHLLLPDSALKNHEALSVPELRDNPSSPRSTTESKEQPSSSQLFKLNNPIESERNTSTLSLRIISPKGNEVYQRGSIVPIRWRGATGTLSVQMSTDGGASWKIIGQAQGDKLDWKIAEESLPTSHALVRLRPYTTDSEDIVAERILPLLSEGFSLDISPNGKWLVTGGRSHEVTIWEVATGRRVRTMLGHTASIQSVRFSQDGSRVVSSAFDSSAIIWHVATGKAEQRLIAPLDQKSTSTSRKRVWWADFSPDGNLVATGHDDGLITIWDARTGDTLSCIYPHNEATRFLKFTQDGMSIIASSSDGSGSLTSIEVGAVPQLFAHRNEREVLEEWQRATTRAEKIEVGRRKVVNCTVLTPDGSVALTCGYDGNVKFWNTATGMLIRSHVYLNGAEIAMLSMSKDGSLVMATGSDGRGVLLDPFSGEVLKRMSVTDGEGMIPMIHSAFFSNGNELAVSHTNGHLSLWKISENEVVSDNEWTIK